LPDSHFILSVLVLIVITWTWNILWFSPFGNGWRGFVECVGWAGFVATFLSLFLIGAGATINRPFRDGELLTVALIELAVFTISTVCTFIPVWFPVTNGTDGTD